MTISTNMAGRGTDILLGGNAAMIARERELGEAELARLREACARDRAEVVAAGGLHVIGTAHHESVRIDDQLRGRAGRQGDPGSSQFIVCLDDEVYEKFGREDLEEIREQLHAAGHAEGEPISTSWVLRTLRGLQQKVDEENRAIRRDLLKYDLVIHAQRETIYGWRRTLVTGEGYDPTRLVREVVADLCAEAEEGASLASALQACFSAPFSFPAEVRSDLFELAAPQAIAQLHSREAAFGAELLHEVGRLLLLEAIDALWTDHLFALEQLEEGIGLRGYAEVDPVLAWRREATEMWQSLMAQIRRRAVTLWFHVALDGARAGADAQQAPPRPAARRPRPHARRRR